MEQLFGVSVAQGVHRFTPVQIEKEVLYIPSPPLSVNVGDASFPYDDEMSENNAHKNFQSSSAWKEVWNDNAYIPSPTPPSPQSNECDVTRRGSKRVSENNNASESSKSCKTESSEKERSWDVDGETRCHGEGSYREKL
ncbi:uncharacterized protein [Spinacia oleracea]|uniref:Uncharacterized protein n=1 Tax=Spinacia oleracea TaxID=3562 RepID=A0ABM3R4K4_SPIOL|nr:uncharacterized protein LOC130465703 [Spinacia oleracea]